MRSAGRGAGEGSQGETGIGGAATRTLVGPGDDAAAIIPEVGQALVVSQDAVVEGVDFERGWLTPHQLGARALAAALSDLAAMGATPSGCLASVCAPVSLCVDDLLALQLGILDAGATLGCPLLGGDLSATTGPLVVDVCVLGAAAPEKLLRRDAGRVGDLLVVTGRLGRAAAGLCLLQGRLDPRGVPDAARELWMRAQRSPTPRLGEGVALAAAGIRCAGDLSDGLLVDAERTAVESGCGAELWLDAVPVDPELPAAAGEEWVALALGGGEDFELLAAVPEPAMAALLEGWQLSPLSLVGRLTAGGGLRLLDRRGGSELPPPGVGARHFAPASR